MNFVHGKRYRVRFRPTGKKAHRVIEGRYIGRNSFHSTYEFYTVPDFALTGIKPQEILGYEEIQ